MGIITFTGSPTVTVNSKPGSTMKCTVRDVSTNPPSEVTFDYQAPVEVDVITGISYNMYNDPSGSLIVSNVKCTSGTNNQGDINYTMTFSLTRNPSNVTIDSESVSIVFNSLVINYKGSNTTLKFQTDTITNYKFYLPYIITVNGQTYSTGTAIGNVGM